MNDNEVNEARVERNKPRPFRLQSPPARNRPEFTREQLIWQVDAIIGVPHSGTNGLRMTTGEIGYYPPTIELAAKFVDKIR